MAAATRISLRTDLIDDGEKRMGYHQWPPSIPEELKRETEPFVDDGGGGGGGGGNGGLALKLDALDLRQFENVVQEIERKDNLTLKTQIKEHKERFGHLPHDGHDVLLRTLGIAIEPNWRSLIEELIVTGQTTWNNIEYHFKSKQEEGKQFESRLHVGLHIAAGSEGVTWKEILGALERIGRRDILKELFSEQHAKKWLELEQSCTTERVLRRRNDGELERNGISGGSATLPQKLPDKRGHQCSGHPEPAQIPVPGVMELSAPGVSGPPIATSTCRTPNSYPNSHTDYSVPLGLPTIPPASGNPLRNENPQGFPNLAGGPQQTPSQGYHNIFGYQYQQMPQPQAYSWMSYPSMMHPPVGNHNQWLQSMSPEMSMCFLPPGLRGGASPYDPYSSFNSTSIWGFQHPQQPQSLPNMNQQSLHNPLISTNSQPNLSTTPNTAPVSINNPMSIGTNVSPFPAPPAQRPEVIPVKNNSSACSNDSMFSDDSFASSVSTSPQRRMSVFLTYSDDAKMDAIKLKGDFESEGCEAVTVEDLLKNQKCTLPQNLQRAFKKVDFIIPILSPKYLEDINNDNPDNVQLSSVRNLYTIYHSNYFHEGSYNFKVRPVHLPSVTYRNYCELAPCLQQPFELKDQMNYFIQMLLKEK